MKNNKKDPRFAGTIDISQRFVCLSLDLKEWGNTRTVKREKIADEKEHRKAAVVVRGNKDRFRGSTKLLISPEIEAISSFDNETRAYLRKICIPASAFKSGVYILPNTLIEHAEDYLQQRLVMRGDLLDEAVEAYPQRHDEAKEDLREHDALSLYDYRDYPSPDGFRASYGMKWRYLAFHVPESLDNVRADIRKREQEKAAAEIKELGAECKSILRSEFAKLVEHMNDRLTPGPDGKRKIFKDTLTENFRDFLRTFEARDLTDDEELKRLVSEASDLMENVEADDLRTDDDLRESLAASFEEMKETLGGMVETEPGRLYIADE